MKTNKKLNYIFLLLLSIIFVFSSCKKSIGDFLNEQFPETTNTSSDIMIDGQAAVPILNTYFTLSNFLPNTKLDSNIWMEVDADKLIHIKMYFKNVFDKTPSEIIPAFTPGDLPPDSISFNTDSNLIPIFANAIEGHFFLNDPKISLIFHNQMPVNLFFRLDSLNFTDSLGNSVRMSQTTDHIIIKGGTGGASITETRVDFDKNSEGLSNFPNMFTPIPRNFNIKMTLGNKKDTTYSGDGTEHLKMDVEMDFPLDFRIQDFIMTDTIPFSPDSTNNTIQSLTLKIFFDNEFPFSGKTQISFVDTNADGKANKTIVNLFNNGGWKFESGVTDSNGKTISSTKSNVKIELTKEQLDSLIKFHASKMLIQSTLNTYNITSNQNVKLLSTYKLGIKIGMKVDYSINLNN